MDLRGQLTVLRRHLLMIVAGTVVAATAAFAISSILPKVFQAQATLLVGQSLSAISPDYNQLLASQQLSQTYAQVATTRPLLQKVIDHLGLKTTPEDLAKHVSADAPPNSTLIQITANDGDPNRAAAIANTLAAQVIAESPAIQGRQASVLQFVDDNLRATQQDIESTQAQIQGLIGIQNRTAAQEQQLELLQARLVALRQTYATLLGFSSSAAPNLLSDIEPAIAPTSPSSPRPLLYTALAAALGLLLMVAVAFGRNALDDTMHTPEDVEATLGLPTLGQIGRLRTAREGNAGLLVSVHAPHSVVAESLRTLRTNIDFASVDAPIRRLLVTSSTAGEGKTVVATNLAVMFAQAGRNVLLVDADLRRPGIHRPFGIANASGLTSLLRDDELAVGEVLRPTQEPLLRVLTTGPLPPNPAELLNSQRMERLMDQLKGEADLLVIDSPPLQVVTDAAILASRVDGALLVVQAGRVRRGTARRGRDVLANANAKILGVVLNQVSWDEGASAMGYYAESVAQAAAAGPASSGASNASVPSARIISEAAAAVRKRRR